MIPPSRPSRLLIGLLLLFCLENAVRITLSIQQARDLPTLQTSLSPLYVATCSVGWAVAFAGCAIGAARSKEWVPGVAILVMLCYQANLWINRLAFSRSSEAIETIGFRAILTVVSFIVLCSILAMQRIMPRVRQLLQQVVDDN